jgi:signal transduction histidine kinase
MNEEIERLQEQLKQTQLAYQMAAQISQFKAGFLARVYHELRSPLSSLMALHKLILCDLCESPEEERTFVLQAYESAQKLMKIIEDILVVSQTEYGTRPLEIVTLQLAEVFADIERLTYLQANHGNINLQILHPDSELYVMADKSALRQALVSLIDAAIAYMKQGRVPGKILVYARPQSGNLVEIQADIECPANIWSEAVDWPQQIPSTTPEAIKYFTESLKLSPGMKLLLSQQLIELMGGKLLLLPLPSSEEKIPFTQLQFQIPLSSVGTVLQKLVNY